MGKRDAKTTWTCSRTSSKKDETSDYEEQMLFLPKALSEPTPSDVDEDVGH